MAKGKHLYPLGRYFLGRLGSFYLNPEIKTKASITFSGFQTLVPPDRMQYQRYNITYYGIFAKNILPGLNLTSSLQ